MKLIVTDRKSAALAIAEEVGAEKASWGGFESEEYLIVSCPPHVIELAAPEHYDKRYAKWRMEDLPIIPSRWLYRVVPGEEERVEQAGKLFHRADVEVVINAACAGAAGELSFGLLCQKFKYVGEVKRLLLNSLETDEIRGGLKNLKPMSEMQNLCRASVVKERAEWLIGINLSRALSLKCHDRFLIGRVSLLILGLVVEDEVRRELGTSGKRYDAAALLAEAGKRYGFGCRQTVDYLDSLYDRRLISYPWQDADIRQIAPAPEDLLSGERLIFELIGCQEDPCVKEEMEQPYTEARLLSDLAGWKIGSPSVWSVHLDKMEAAGLIERYDRFIVPTPRGRKLYQAAPERQKNRVKALSFAQDLSKVESGEMTANEFMRRIEAEVRRMVIQIRSNC